MIESEQTARIDIVNRYLLARELTAGEFSADLSNLVDYAFMSSAVYGTENDLTVPEPWEEITFDDPISSSGPRCRKVLHGLKVQIWGRSTNDAKTVVIVFRGTVPKLLGNWFSNFRWLTQFIPLVIDHYDQTVDWLPRIHDVVQSSKYNGANIVAVGHSLGGGLAQFAAYSTSWINLVVSFNPSPVTGWRSIPRWRRDAYAPGTRNYRIYEHGEFLTHPRYLMKLIYFFEGGGNTEIEFVQVRLNYDKAGSAFSQHAMKEMALSLQNSCSHKEAPDPIRRKP